MRHSFSPVANIESSSLTGSSLKRQSTENSLSLEGFILTVEATVLKVIGILLYQPIDNDALVILNIVVTLIACKSPV